MEKKMESTIIIIGYILGMYKDNASFHLCLSPSLGTKTWASKRTLQESFWTK